MTSMAAEVGEVKTSGGKRKRSQLEDKAYPMKRNTTLVNQIQQEIFTVSLTKQTLYMVASNIIIIMLMME